MPKKTPNDLYWDAKEKGEARRAYEQFLADKDVQGSPHYADVFAARVTADGFTKYMGMTKRELILFLEGKLPYMYD